MTPVVRRLTSVKVLPDRHPRAKRPRWRANIGTQSRGSRQLVATRRAPKGPQRSRRLPATPRRTGCRQQRACMSDCPESCASNPTSDVLATATKDANRVTMVHLLARSPNPCVLGPQTRAKTPGAKCTWIGKLARAVASLCCKDSQRRRLLQGPRRTPRRRHPRAPPERIGTCQKTKPRGGLPRPPEGWPLNDLTRLRCHRQAPPHPPPMQKGALDRPATPAEPPPQRGRSLEPPHPPLPRGP
mmetsp:Transcript_177739/g.569848  ORF Transcript_177739/g.569848 Transcript_177739/m.569848 type:complete len:243 (+) Transcript_177739:4779-5507(+)